MCLTWGEQTGLLVADVPWSVLHTALVATGCGEQFEVGDAVGDWEHWYQEFPARGISTLLAGEYNGRSFVYAGSSTVAPVDADRIVAIAGTTRALVLGHIYADGAGCGDGIAASSDGVLRYVVDGWSDSHIEGVPLAGETDELTIASSEGFNHVLAALGFEVDAWLANGSKWEVTWTSLEMDEQDEAFLSLYRGPVRMRSIWVEEAALAEYESEGGD
jgi:hypothetical protein